MASSEERPPLRILCFGDSLTAGYTNWGISFFPYGDTLREVLGEALPTGPGGVEELQVDVDGFSGDQVRGNFLRRLRRACEKAQYDWIVVLGGTNDLGWGQKPAEIYENLKKVWSLALSSGAKVLALNVIEAGGSSDGMTKKRDDLNAMIMSHSEPNYYTCDMHAAIRYNGISDEKRAEIWNDGVHLNMEGYELMGRVVAARLLELLQPVNNGQ